MRNSVRGALSLSACEFLDNKVVNTLDRDDYEGKMAELILQVIDIKDGLLKMRLGL